MSAETRRSNGDLLGLVPRILEEELVETLVATAGARIERIVSTGQVSPPGFWYDQDEHEFVLVVSGSGRIEWEDGDELELGPGDWAWIPAGVRHRVARTDPVEPTVWLAFFVPAGAGGLRPPGQS